MRNKLLQSGVWFALATVGGTTLVGCAETKAKVEHAVASKAATDAVETVASKVGVSPHVADVAVKTAEGYLAETPKNDATKYDAAQQGTRAADQAAAEEGRPLTQGQRVSLVDVLRKVL